MAKAREGGEEGEGGFEMNYAAMIRETFLPPSRAGKHGVLQCGRRRGCACRPADTPRRGAAADGA